MKRILNSSYHFRLFDFFVPLEIFHSYGDVTIADEGLCSALMAIEQWEFFSVPRLLWHGTSVYNGHLRGPVTLKPIAERSLVELSLPVFTTYVCRSWGLNTQPSACGANALTHWTAAAAYIIPKRNNSEDDICRKELREEFFEMHSRSSNMNKKYFKINYIYWIWRYKAYIHPVQMWNLLKYNIGLMNDVLMASAPKDIVTFLLWNGSNQKSKSVKIMHISGNVQIM